eukprot:g4556.t1
MHVQACVVGAGVVGLAVARALAMRGQEVVVLEAARAVGSATSSRNSEVVHAGLYYEPGSLKAAMCVAGRHALYAYCDARGVQYKRCGKLIVAARAEETAQLELIRARAETNGVDDLRLLSGAEARELEPEVRCHAALLSPSTGVVDSHAFLAALQADAEAHGATIVLDAAVRGGRAASAGDGAGDGVGAAVVLDVAGEELACDRVVNAAGLHAPALARAIAAGGAGGGARGAGAAAGAAAAAAPASHFAKGSYFALEGQRPPFSRLVYPVPDPSGAGLGVHATVDLGGAVRFGPDVEWLPERLGCAEGAPLADERAAAEAAYAVDGARAAGFYGAVRRYWPALRDGALMPDYSGIRPKLAPAAAGASDFLLAGPRAHGVAGLLHMLGMESPGLTASLALAERAAHELLGEG